MGHPVSHPSAGTNGCRSPAGPDPPVDLRDAPWYLKTHGCKETARVR